MRYHADPILSEFGMLKVGDLYRQQLRVHAWHYWNGKLPENQAAMLGRVGGRAWPRHQISKGGPVFVH